MARLFFCVGILPALQTGLVSTGADKKGEPGVRLFHILPSLIQHQSL